MAKAKWLKEHITELMNASEGLKSVEEFHLLTDLQKQMCHEHVHYPELTKTEIAYKLGIAKSNVYSFFHSEKWRRINDELAKQQIRELVQLAVKTLRESMLKGTSSVRLEAAVRVLVNGELLRPTKGNYNVKQDNKMIVLFDEDGATTKKSEKRISSEGNGDTHPVQSALEAEGSPRGQDALQGSGGWQTVGKDNLGDQRIDTPSDPKPANA